MGRLRGRQDHEGSHLYPSRGTYVAIIKLSIIDNQGNLRTQFATIKQTHPDEILVSTRQGKSYVLKNADRLMRKDILGFPRPIWIVSENSATPTSLHLDNAGLKPTKITDERLHSFIHFQRLKELMIKAGLAKLETIILIGMIASIIAIVGIAIVYFQTSQLDAKLQIIQQKLDWIINEMQRLATQESSPGFVQSNATIPR